MEEKKVPSAVATKQPDDEQKKEEKYLLDSEEKIEIAMKNENRKSPFLFPLTDSARALQRRRRSNKSEQKKQPSVEIRKH